MRSHVSHICHLVHTHVRGATGIKDQFKEKNRISWRTRAAAYYKNLKPLRVDSPFEIFVLTGEVTVEYQDSREVLLAGEKAIVTANDGIHKSINDDPNFNSWYTGFNFQ